MGQATTAVFLIVGYLSAIMLSYRLWNDEIAQFHSELPLLLYALFGGPLIVILIFSILPTFLRGLRERRLTRLLDNGGSNKPGHFRLAPYDENDRECYVRPDGALEKALGWLLRANKNILYLSGASGSGKSSLVNAGIVPTLKDLGWRTLIVRGMGEPMEALTDSLRSAERLYRQAPPKDAEAEDLLRLISDEIARAEAEPLLIALDQFEEFLILKGGEEKEVYSDFLDRLTQNPIPGIRIIHVFREDYRALLFKYDLPRYVPGDTGFELPPFTRTEAQIFLEGGRKTLDAKDYDRLFAGLDRIENARGLYRPITLNMVGYVLDQEGSELEDDPGSLIETYLKRCIARGPSRDFAKTVLAAMITSEGTKQAIAENSLVETTGIADFYVKATLTDLQEDGLVRPLAGSKWEISHDFLAFLIARISGRLRTSFLTRYATPIVAVTLVGWISAMAVALPAWAQWKERQAISSILALGFVREPDFEDGLSFSQLESEISDEDLLEVKRASGHLNIRSLKINLCGEELTSLESLSNLELKALYIYRPDCSRFSPPNLDFLSSMPLQILEMNSPGTKNIEALSGLPLENLAIRYSSHFESIEPISTLRNLRILELSLSNNEYVTSVDALSGLSIEELDISLNNSISTLNGLTGLPLTKLRITSAERIASLEPLTGMKLRSLIIFGAEKVTSLEPLEGMPLENLTISDAGLLDDLGPLRGMALKHFKLSHAPFVTSLEPLVGAPLQSLSLYELGIAYLAPEHCEVVGISAFGSDPLKAICPDR
ncbi:hypothetical protein EDD52_1552 [Primorskyibacter sedentarius]|uniref:Novel STAND NTPase 1 domain-containing protein n=2 Tax=Primorskyibacter sedentarius TaxID=745311 RepID=A0A4R3IM06_9RHOB|nr:hypothetical protein EDD52_1552 [Primorskyibacter sedentarius]